MRHLPALLFIFFLSPVRLGHPSACMVPAPCVACGLLLRRVPAAPAWPWEGPSWPRPASSALFLPSSLPQSTVTVLHTHLFVCLPRWNVGSGRRSGSPLLSQHLEWGLAPETPVNYLLDDQVNEGNGDGTWGLCSQRLARREVNGLPGLEIFSKAKIKILFVSEQHKIYRISKFFGKKFPCQMSSGRTASDYLK